jgi:penicillin-binding protein 1A
MAYATFPNLGRAVVPHAALEVRTDAGQLVWRFDRDGPKPKQVISPEVAIDMIKMMNSVVENGTGRRAQLDGVPTCGKTGTTNDWRDAWFVGYTGNFVGAVWMGNDDYSPTKRMTGGTLPAATWHNIMAYAHQGVELRPLPGLPAPQHAPAVAEASLKDNAQPHAVLLTRKGTEALLHVERILDDAIHAPSSQAETKTSVGALDGSAKSGSASRSNALATTADRNAAGNPRGD